MEVEKENRSYFAEESALEESLDQTGFLLQRLQELQAWQKEQELQLLREQENQLERLCMANECSPNVHFSISPDERSDEDDEDTTIGHDVPSLASVDENPRNDVKECDSVTPRSDVADALDSSTLPSWASREDLSMAKKNTSDERPILPKNKSFDQILDEQLRHQTLTPPRQAETQTGTPATEPKKTFLRKGSGLARFGGVGAPPKRMVRSKSQGFSKPSNKALSGSCPRINIAERETIAFASKKSTPKVSRSVPAKTSSVPHTARPASILKLTPSSGASLPKKESTPMSSAVAVKGATKPFQKGSSTESSNGVHDSVELSFMEKLARAENHHRKDLEDLKTFEMLEEAACDSSFCSSSSTVKKLIQNVHHMPSPIPKPSGSLESLTSTPISSEKFVRRSLASSLNHIPAKANGSSAGSEDDTLEEISMEGERSHARTDEASILNGSLSDDEDFIEKQWRAFETANQAEQPKGKNRVHFEDGAQNEALSYSPPRIPSNASSYLIWSIFGKDREEKPERKNGSQDSAKANGKTAVDSFMPLSDAKLSYPKTEYDFHTTLLNGKLAELEKEITHFKSENEKLMVAKRKLQADRKQLAENVKSFEQTKETEKKKLDEERKWVRREKALFEKIQKEKKSSLEKRTHEEVEDLRNKVRQLNEDLQRKETKWAAAMTKLQEQVKFLEKENQHLHQENHKLKIKGASAKISTHLLDPYHAAKKLSSPGQTQNGTPDSGFRSQDNLNDAAQPAKTPTNIKACIYNTLCENSSDTDNELGSKTVSNGSSEIETPRMTFSPVESLESSVTLVSASTHMVTSKNVASNPEGTEKNSSAVSQASTNVVVKSVVTNKEKGTTEKIYSDGSKEICFANGNRKEISPDGSTTKVLYYNGDVKETLPSGLVKYFYSQTKTWHLNYPGGKEVLQFSNGQEEIRFPNGNLQITFSDGSVKKISPDGSEHITFTDGTKILVDPNGDRTLFLPNGQKEIHTSNLKRREYPDGTVRILYEDGRHETRYPSGRVRIKTRDGKLLHDSQNE